MLLSFRTPLILIPVRGFELWFKGLFEIWMELMRNLLEKGEHPKFAAVMLHLSYLEFWMVLWPWNGNLCREHLFVLAAGLLLCAILVFREVFPLHLPSSKSPPSRTQSLSKTRSLWYASHGRFETFSFESTIGRNIWTPSRSFNEALVALCEVHNS